MRRRHREGRHSRVFFESIAGWVFADLLLVLFIVGLASAIPVDPPEPPPPTPRPAHTKKPKVIVGMKTEPIKKTVRFNASELTTPGKPGKAERKRVCKAIRKAVAGRVFDGRRAALVLIFGGASEAETGQRVARTVGKQLRCADKALFKGAPYRDFWDGSLRYGAARLEVFVFTTKKPA